MNTINELYAQIAEYQNYLQLTDYHRLKAAEGAYTVPADIIAQSQHAREEIDRLRAEITTLEQELEEDLKNLKTTEYETL